MTFNPVERRYSLTDGANDLDPVFTLPDVPLYMGCTDQPAQDDVKMDMNFYISRGSGMIQLDPLVPLEILYSISHTPGSPTSATWRAHHQSFAKFIRGFSPQSVLEVGGSHGILSMNYHEEEDIPWTIVEPDPVPVEGCKAKFIKIFFDSNFVPEEPFDLVACSHVMEHVYYPDEFFGHLAVVMPEGSILALSSPNMRVGLEKYYSNMLNFEHTYLLTEPYMEYFLAKNGFQIVKTEYFLEDHSFFIAAKRVKEKRTGTLPRELYTRNKNLIQNYVRYYRDCISRINASIKSSSGPVYLFGAHIFSQNLLAFGLDPSKIVGLLDNDPSKQGRRLYGTPFMTFSPISLKGQKDVTVILRAGAYDEEIKSGIQAINPHVSFI